MIKIKLEPEKCLVSHTLNLSAGSLHGHSLAKQHYGYIKNNGHLTLSSSPKKKFDILQEYTATS